MPPPLENCNNVLPAIMITSNCDNIDVHNYCTVTGTPELSETAYNKLKSDVVSYLSKGIIIARSPTINTCNLKNCSNDILLQFEYMKGLF